MRHERSRTLLKGPSSGDEEFREGQRTVRGVREALGQEVRAGNNEVRPGNYPLCVDGGGAGAKAARDMDGGDVPVRRAQEGVLVAGGVKESAGDAGAGGQASFLARVGLDGPGRVERRECFGADICSKPR